VLTVSAVCSAANLAPDMDGVIIPTLVCITCSTASSINVWQPCQQSPPSAATWQPMEPGKGMENICSTAMAGNNDWMLCGYLDGYEHRMQLPPWQQHM